MKRFQPLIVVAAISLLSGCWTTTLSSGKPAAAGRPAVDGHWHSGILTGGVDLSGPYELDQVCPNGWAEIQTETSVANELVEIVTFHLYAPQTVRVTCAERAAL